MKTDPYHTRVIHGLGRMLIRVFIGKKMYLVKNAIQAMQAKYRRHNMGRAMVRIGGWCP